MSAQKGDILWAYCAYVCVLCVRYYTVVAIRYLFQFSLLKARRWNELHERNGYIAHHCKSVSDF
jgi:hypothetical protein